MAPAGAAGSGCFGCRNFSGSAAGTEEIILALMGAVVFGGRGIDAHAANRIDRARRSGLGSLAMFAGTAGRCRRRGAMMMAGVNRTVCVIAVGVIPIQLRHPNSRGLLIYIP